LEIIEQSQMLDMVHQRAAAERAVEAQHKAQQQDTTQVTISQRIPNPLKAQPPAEHAEAITTIDGVVVEGNTPPTPTSSLSTLADEERINALEKQTMHSHPNPNPEQVKQFELMIGDIVCMGLTREEAETALRKTDCASVVEAVEWHFQQQDQM